MKTIGLVGWRCHKKGRGGKTKLLAASLSVWYRTYGRGILEGRVQFEIRQTQRASPRVSGLALMASD